MEKPDESLFEEDVASAEFRSGTAKGRWGLAPSELLPPDVKWPTRIFWIAAAPRTNSPQRFYLCLDLAGYRSVPPTGTFWDPATKASLEVAKRPKGKANTRCAKVFRTDWNNAALYHPYDRVAAQGHNKWPEEQPHLVWTSSRTIVDYLEEIHALLNGGDYSGV
jgi:hypothetical protein